MMYYGMILIPIALVRPTRGYIGYAPLLRPSYGKEGESKSDKATRKFKFVRISCEDRDKGPLHAIPPSTFSIVHQ
jgi:hypothetical protein